MKINKILYYVKGINLQYGYYGLKYKFFDINSNYSRAKYGKEKFLTKKLKKVINKYKNFSKYSNISINNKNKKHFDKFPIYFCWFQGLENAPEVVKICYNSLKLNVPKNCKIHVITYDNINDYINIPNYITKKMQNGKINLALYSDFIRISLLERYGGFWIDSTVLVTNNIEKLCNYEYYTKKTDRIEDNFGNYLVQGRFTIHLLKANNDNILVNFIYDALKLYYKKFNVPIDYYMTNLLADIAYNNIPKVKEMMDNFPINDRGFEARLCENLNEVFDEKFYQLCKENMPFQKLNHKLPKYLEQKNGKETFYGHIKKEYGIKI